MALRRHAKRMHSYNWIFCYFISINILRFCGFVDSQCPPENNGTAVLFYNSSCFEFIYKQFTFVEALYECQRKGGYLAKITPALPEEILGDIYKKLLCLCAYIGVSDMEKEGDWKWLDGSPATDIPWDFRAFAIPIEGADDPHLQTWDYGRICYTYQDNNTLSWEQSSGVPKYCCICQYDTPKETTRKPRITVKPMEKRRKPTVSVLARKRQEQHISGLWIFDMRVYSFTMCSRQCDKHDKCAMVNFNTRTLQCRGFDPDETLKYDSNPDWEVWEEQYNAE